MIVDVLVKSTPHDNFLDEEAAAQYGNEERLRRLISVFMGLAILISSSLPFKSCTIKSGTAVILSVKFVDA